MADFLATGDWRSYYRYPSTGRAGDYWGQHLLHATQDGNTIRLESGPESASQVTMELTLDIDGKIARGTWQERTDLEGYYKGAVYEGTIELNIAENGERMNGVWHGAGKDGAMNTDIWELAKAKPWQHSGKRPCQWKLTHWYPSADDSTEESDEHVMTGHWTGDNLVLESEPRAGTSYMLVRLLVQDDVARGSWHESSLPDGEYKGAEYSGAGELVVDAKTLHMEGQWAGSGYDHKLEKMRVYTGRWELTPLEEKR